MNEVRIKVGDKEWRSKFLKLWLKMWTEQQRILQ